MREGLAGQTRPAQHLLRVATVGFEQRGCDYRAVGVAEECRGCDAGRRRTVAKPNRRTGTVLASEKAVRRDGLDDADPEIGVALRESGEPRDEPFHRKGRRYRHDEFFVLRRSGQAGRDPIDPDQWCQATTISASGAAATPGAPNDPCTDDGQDWNDLDLDGCDDDVYDPDAVDGRPAYRLGLPGTTGTLVAPDLVVGGAEAYEIAVPTGCMLDLVVDAADGDLLVEAGLEGQDGYDDGASVGTPFAATLFNLSGSQRAATLLVASPEAVHHVLVGRRENYLKQSRGYRAFRASTLRALDLDGVGSAGYIFQVDLAYRTLAKGMRVVEVPIEFVEREVGDSKMNRKIVSEALWRVTVWGVRERVHQARDALAERRERT